MFKELFGLKIWTFKCLFGAGLYGLFKGPFGASFYGMLRGCLGLVFMVVWGCFVGILYVTFILEN